MGSWNDFNDAQSNTNLIPKGTLAKVRLTIRPGGFDDAAQGWTGGYATRGSTGAVYLNGEFTVTEGQYAECGEAVQDGDTNLELRDLTVEVPRHEALTQQFRFAVLRFTQCIFVSTRLRR